MLLPVCALAGDDSPLTGGRSVVSQYIHNILHGEALISFSFIVYILPLFYLCSLLAIKSLKYAIPLAVVLITFLVIFLGADYPEEGGLLIVLGGSAIYSIILIPLMLATTGLSLLITKKITEIKITDLRKKLNKTLLIILLVVYILEFMALDFFIISYVAIDYYGFDYYFKHFI